MKKECYKIDEQGYIVEHYLLEEKDIPSDYITVLPQDGLYQPLRWTGTEWREGLTQEEIDAIKNQPQPKTEIEILKEQLELEKANSTSVSATLMDFMDFYFQNNPDLA